ncbi:MAG: inorganic phosphate transporter [Polyangiaceae bacterium]
MDSAAALLIAVVVVAIAFDYINGFHDAANAIATVVSTGVLPVRTAVLIAGVLNFAGAVMGTAVAKTISADFTDSVNAPGTVILAALIGACVWNIITWYYGIPSSSTHALIGGLAGAVVTYAGTGAFKWAALGKKVLLPLVLSPTIGFTIAFFLMIGLLWVFRRVRPSLVQSISRKLQLVSAGFMALSHGSNDAQKSMGVIALALTAFASKHDTSAMPKWIFQEKPDHIPLWVVVACASAIGLGTMAGGKRIIKTMGSKIIRIVPLQGFAAESAGAATILSASALGIPVSTTHVINACIMGVGASKRVSAVRWGVAGNILLAWVLTLPAAALIAALAMLVIRAV